MLLTIVLLFLLQTETSCNSDYDSSSEDSLLNQTDFVQNICKDLEVKHPTNLEIIQCTSTSNTNIVQDQFEQNNFIDIGNNYMSLQPVQPVENCKEYFESKRENEEDKVFTTLQSLQPEKSMGNSDITSLKCETLTSAVQSLTEINYTSNNGNLQSNST